MKSTATITFHASHNYGSMLQAYALQQVIISLGYKNEIINLRTDRQRDLYQVFTKRKGLKYILKNLSHLFYYKSLKKRYDNFEKFLSDYLILSEKEFKNSDDIKKAHPIYDCYIAGSDQIWNPIPADFDWAYYLDFVEYGKRISYAASFGQLASLGNAQTQNKISNLLKSFDFISVREAGAAANVKKLTNREATIVLDPTLLINQDEWEKIIPDNIPDEGDYIFFYTLFADPKRLKIVKTISQKTGFPVITTNFSNQYDLITPFKKRYSCGPLEFLYLVKKSKLSICSSFHGTVFSYIFGKPFLAIDGLEDARIMTLLTTLGMEHRSVSIDNIDEKIGIAFHTDDFAQAKERLHAKQTESIEILKHALENI